MNQLFTYFLGNISAAWLGSMLQVSFATFVFAKHVAITVGVLGIFLPKMRFPLFLFGLMIWTLIHNQKTWDLGATGTIIRANGCGFVADDVLVKSMGIIGVAKGRGIEGDEVRRVTTFANTDSRFVVENPLASTSFGCYFAGSLRSRLLKRLSEWPAGRREWLQSFMLGADMQLDGLTLASLRRLGLLHIVVLSGSHVAIISIFTLLLLRFVPLALYSLRIVDVRVWRLVWTITGFLCLIAMLLFSLTVGAPQSVQRAVVLFVVLQLSDLVWIRKPIGEVLLLVWLVQAMIFPVHILSLSMFLSWSGSLILSGVAQSHFRRSFFEVFREKILIQSLFALSSCIVFGSIGIVSIFANLLFAPIFSLVLPLNFLLLFSYPNAWITVFLVDLQMKLLALVRAVDLWQLNRPELGFSLRAFKPQESPLRTGLQIGFILALGARVYVRTKKRIRDSL